MSLIGQYDAELPAISGEIDDIKALDFASRLCRLVASGADVGQAGGALQADAQRAASALGALLDNARGLEQSALERFAFLETMLRRDGMAVVIYLEASEVRATLEAQGHDGLSQALTDEAIGQHLHEMLDLRTDLPAGLAAWCSETEQKAAAQLVAAQAAQLS